MHDVLLEAAKQAPQLAVLAWVVWRFLSVITTITARHEVVAERFADITERAAYVIGENTATLQRLNGGGGGSDHAERYG